MRRWALIIMVKKGWLNIRDREWGHPTSLIFLFCGFVALGSLILVGVRGKFGWMDICPLLSATILCWIIAYLNAGFIKKLNSL